MDSELPDIKTHRICRSCGEWLKPEYGSMYARERGSLFTPGALVRDIVSDVSGDTSHCYFRCHDCEDKRKMRRVYVFGGLIILVLLVCLARYLLEN